jgi:hypothetical protein
MEGYQKISYGLQEAIRDGLEYLGLICVASTRQETEASDPDFSRSGRPKISKSYMTSDFSLHDGAALKQDRFNVLISQATGIPI